MLKKFKITLLVVLAINFTTPSVVLAKVYINEIAWMGTSVSSSDEWIELYNSEPIAVDLTGWTLSWNTTAVKFQLVTIAPGGYLLMERTDDTTIPDISADFIYTGALRNAPDGELLILKDKDDEIDRVDGVDGWKIGGLEIVGNNTTKETAQRTDSGWITATSTPRAVNAIVANTNMDEATDTPETVNSDNTSDNELTDLSAHSSPADLSDAIPEVKISASAGRNRLALVGAPVTFEEKLYTDKDEIIDGGNVLWSFGDGQTATGKIIVHTYKFPGDYAVVMNVHRNAEDYVSRTNVRVVEPDVAITEVTPEYIKIKNRSIYEANLGEWRVDSGRAIFVFPKDTIIKEKGDLTLGREIAGLVLDTGRIKLLSPAGKIISSFEIKSAQGATPKDGQVSASGGKVETVKDNNLSRVDIKEDSIIINEDAITAVLLSGLEQKLLSAKNALALLQNAKIDKVVSIAPVEDLIPKKEFDISEAVLTEELGVGEEIQIIEKPKSIFRTLLNAPVNSFRYIKDLIF